MPWTCRLIENPELNEHGNVDIAKRKIGDMWFLDVPTEELRNRELTDEYFAVNSNRKPLVVLLPGRNVFLIDGKCCSDGGFYGGWNVSGTPPAITVAPSINAEGRYHGYLIAGVISDDCEGRKFQE
jgi:hypothetical protein